MPLSTNFNVSPYFDDYDITKEYYRILFKPKKAVQARELNQIQSIIQNQIEQFGNSIYKNGSIITGCSVTEIPNFDFVRLSDADANNNLYVATTLLANTIAVSTNSGLTALVLLPVNGLSANYPNTNVIYIRYMNSGSYVSNGSTIEVKTFQPNEQIKFYQNPLSGNVVVATINTFANSTVNTTTTGYGYGIQVSDGLIYDKGYFLVVDPQVGIVSSYVSDPGNNLVGFAVNETIVTSDQDTSLLDNSLGYANLNAPGADRLKLVPVLNVVDMTNSTNADYSSNTSTFIDTQNTIPIVRYNYGNPVIVNQDPVYSVIGKEMNRRLYETSGNFVINPFAVDTLQNVTNNDLITIAVSPGLGYAQGQRVQLVNTFKYDVVKGINTQTSSEQIITADYANYLVVNEFAGTFDFKNLGTVQLYDTAQKAVTNKLFTSLSPSGNVIGIATLRSVRYDTGTVGSNNALYFVYVTQINCSNFSNVKSIYYSSGSTVGVADVVLTNSQPTLNPQRDTLLYTFGASALKTIANGNNAVNAQYLTRRETSSTLAVNGAVSFAYTTGKNGSGQLDKLPYGLGPLGDLTIAADLIVSLVSNVQSVNCTGTVSVSSSSNVVTGSGTSFNTQFQAQELIKIGSDIRTITAVTNSTSLQVDSVFSTTNASATYVKYFPAGYTFPINSLSVGGRFANVTSNTTMTIQTGASVAANLATTANVIVTHNILRTNALAKTKAISKGCWVKIDTSAHAQKNLGPWSLGIPDVHQVTNIYVGNTTYANTNADLLSQFYFQPNQTESVYGGASIALKPGATITANSLLLVKLDAFTPNVAVGAGFFSVDSYPIDDANTANTTAITTANIPVVTLANGSVISLRDAIDFRPYFSNTANITSNVSLATINPATPNSTSYNVDSYGEYLASPDGTFESDITYYLGRNDLIYFDKNGNLFIKDGAPGVNPITPAIPQDGMEIASLTIPPYPTLSSAEVESLIAVNKTSANGAIRNTSYNTQIQLLGNKRYTMKDIGVLDKRIAQLEYYVTLNSLEATAATMQVPDANGLNRFKNGIFVEPFTSHLLGDVTNPEYKISIDTDIDVARPYFDSAKINLSYNAGKSSNVVFPSGRALLLPYSQAWFIQQQFATQYRNIAPVAYKWNGTVHLYPSYSDYVNKTAPAQIQVVDNESQVWNQFANSPWGTDYGQWRITQQSTANTYSKQTTSSGVTATKTVTTTTTSTQNVYALSVSTTNTTYNLGTYVTDISVQPYIASVPVAFAATNLRPNTNLHIFFDGVNVDQYCAPSSPSFTPFTFPPSANSTILNPVSAYGTQIRSDANGCVYGTFLIPSTSFRVGDRVLTIADVSDLGLGNNAITTIASATFTASNITVKQATATLTTVDPVLNYTVTNQTQVTSNTTTIKVYSPASPPAVVVPPAPPPPPSPPPLPVTPPAPPAPPPPAPSASINTSGKIQGETADPIAQGLTISLPDSVSGCYLTGIQLFFAQASLANNGVSVYLTEQDNGYPSNNIIPFSYVHLNKSQINVSNNATTATTFYFPVPVYVSGNSNYAFTVKPDGNDPDYRIWTAVLGNLDVTTKAQVSQAPYTQTLYVSAQGSTYTAIQNEYIKFNALIASFSTLSGTAVFTMNPDDFISVKNITYANTTTSIMPNDVVYYATNTTPNTVNTSVRGVLYYNDDRNGLQPRLYLTQSTGLFTYANTHTLQVHRFPNSAIATGSQVPNANTLIATCNVVSVDDLKGNAIVPYLTNITPPGTNITWQYLGVSNSYTWDSSYNVVPLNVETELLDYERLGMSFSNMTVNFPGQNTSILMVGSMTSNTSYLSPLIDTIRTSVLYVHNLVDPTSTNTYNEYFANSTIQSKYVSSPITLQSGQDSEELQLTITAYRPPNTSLLMYGRFLSENDSESIYAKTWSPMIIDNANNYSDPLNLADVRELTYTLPANNVYNITTLNGTINVSSGSANVSGIGTNFTTQLNAGAFINISNTQIVQIQSIANDTVMVLASNVLTTNTAASYYLSTPPTVAYFNSNSTTLQTGTVTTYSTNTLVTGSGTNFTSLGVNTVINVGVDNRTIVAIANNTSLTVDTPFSTNSVANVFYTSTNVGTTYIDDTGASHNSFISFAVKLVYLADNSAQIPRVHNIRGLALQV